MFKLILNELQVQLEMRPVSPLLIKEGRHNPPPQQIKERRREQPSQLCFHQGVTRTPKQPRRRDSRELGDYANPEDCFDMAFVFSRTPRGDQFYIPGSSLRGVFRSTAERIVGRWRPDLAHDPFAGSDKQLIAKTATASSPNGVQIYQQSLPLERCFGHTLLRGRWTIPDAWILNDQDARVVVRDGVGINRKTGAAQHAIKFSFETITAGVFQTTLTLVNYELWQLGLLAYLLAALDGGEAHLGYGTMRGLGRVQVRVSRLLWRWYRRGAAPPPTNAAGSIVIPSLAQLAKEASLPDTERYGWQDSDLAVSLPLVRQTDAPGGLIPIWILDFATGKPMDWDASPWSLFGPLLPEALTRWPTTEANE